MDKTMLARVKVRAALEAAGAGVDVVDVCDTAIIEAASFEYQSGARSAGAGGYVPADALPHPYQRRAMGKWPW